MVICMKKNFFLLGGNLLNFGIYKKLKQKNFYVVLIDWNSNPQITGDMHIQLDVKDHVRVIQEIENLGVKREEFFGCFTSIDAAVYTQALIYERFGYVYGGPNIDAAMAKSRMMDLWKNHNLVTRKSITVKPADSAELQLFATSQVIVKPNRAASSRSITICDISNDAQIETAIKEASEESIDNKVVIEEFVNGTEYTVEMLIDRNQMPAVYAISKKYHTPYLKSNRVANKLHYNPSDVPVALLERIADFGKNCFKALGLKNSFGHLEVIVDDSGNIHPIEMGARSSGFIASPLVDKVSGRDYIQDLLDIVFKGKTLQDDYYLGDVSSMYFFYDFPAGQKIIKDIDLMEIAPKKIKSAFSLKESLRKGHTTGTVKNEHDRLGVEVLYGPSEALTIEKITALEKSLHANVEDHKE